MGIHQNIGIYRLFILGILFLSSKLYAWEPSSGILLSQSGTANYSPRMIKDKQGNVIVVWLRYLISDTTNQSYDIYAQKVNHNGFIQWDTGGIPICNAKYFQTNPQIVTDNFDGAIITWGDYRNTTNNPGSDFSIYAQRVNGSSSTLWYANGIPLCTVSSKRENLQMISDNLGGAIIAWNDDRNGDHDIYIQHINGDGIFSWDTNGWAICTAQGDQYNPQLACNTAGHILITWTDERNDNGSGENSDIYAQNINIQGRVNWENNGIPLCITSNIQTENKIIFNELGNGIIAWRDFSTPSSPQIYAQRVSMEGNLLWKSGGIKISSIDSVSNEPLLVTDQENGSILTWSGKYSTTSGIFCQRIDEMGKILWSEDIPIAMSYEWYESVTRISNGFISDGHGGIIISWIQTVSHYPVKFHNSLAPPFPSHYNKFQRINNSGNKLWSPYNVTIGYEGEEPNQIISDGYGGYYILLVSDSYMSVASDLYLQLMDKNGNVNPPSNPIDLSLNLTSDRFIQLNWNDTSSMEKGFGIDIKIGEGDWEVLDWVGTDVTTYIHHGVNSGNSYCYRVYAWNGAGLSGYSNEACVQIPTGIKEEEWMMYP